MDDLHDFGRRPPWPSKARVLQYVREALVDGVTESEVLCGGRRKTRKIATVRWAVIARLRADGASLTAIGDRLNLDHSTVKLALVRMRYGLIPFQRTGEKIAAMRRRRTPRGIVCVATKQKPLPLIPYAGFDRTERAVDWR